MSPNRLVVTIIEALRVHHQVHAGGVDDHLLVLDVRVAGRDLTGHFRNRPEVDLRMLALWMMVTFLRPSWRASSKAKVTMRSAPSRVMMLIASALWLSSLRFWPMPSVFSRTVMMSMLS